MTSRSMSRLGKSIVSLPLMVGMARSPTTECQIGRTFAGHPEVRRAYPLIPGLGCPYHSGTRDQSFLFQCDDLEARFVGDQRGLASTWLGATPPSRPIRGQLGKWSDSSEAGPVSILKGMR